MDSLVDTMVNEDLPACPSCFVEPHTEKNFPDISIKFTKFVIKFLFPKFYILPWSCVARNVASAAHGMAILFVCQSIMLVICADPSLNTFLLCSLCESLMVSLQMRVIITKYLTNLKCMSHLSRTVRQFFGCVQLLS